MYPNAVSANHFPLVKIATKENRQTAVHIKSVKAFWARKKAHRHLFNEIVPATRRTTLVAITIESVVEPWLKQPFMLLVDELETFTTQGYWAAISITFWNVVEAIVVHPTSIQGNRALLKLFRIGTYKLIRDKFEYILLFSFSFTFG